MHFAALILSVRRSCNESYVELYALRCQLKAEEQFCACHASMQQPEAFYFIKKPGKYFSPGFDYLKKRLLFSFLVRSLCNGSALDTAALH
jgi:hypothetical protein